MPHKDVVRVAVVSLLSVALTGPAARGGAAHRAPGRSALPDRPALRRAGGGRLAGGARWRKALSRRAPRAPDLQADAYGLGLNLRAHSLDRAGEHVLRAIDALGNEAVSRFEIVDPFKGGGLDSAKLVGDSSLRGERPARNIIIMLGDGMGVAHRTAARIVQLRRDRGASPTAASRWTRFPGTGLVTTHSLNSIVTDSAPGMAVLRRPATTRNNNQEGVFPATRRRTPFYNPRVEYLSEYLHRTQGKSLGIVTTADVEDATPAANAVHTGNRGAGTGIVDQYLDERDRTGLAVLLGGGRRWFLPAATQFGSEPQRPATTTRLCPPTCVGRLGLPPPGAVDPEPRPDRRLPGRRLHATSTTRPALRRRRRQAAAALLGLFALRQHERGARQDRQAPRRALPDAPAWSTTTTPPTSRCSTR